MIIRKSLGQYNGNLSAVVHSVQVCFMHFVMAYKGFYPPILCSHLRNVKNIAICKMMITNVTKKIGDIGYST